MIEGYNVGTFLVNTTKEINMTTDEINDKCKVQDSWHKKLNGLLVSDELKHLCII